MDWPAPATPTWQVYEGTFALGSGSASLAPVAGSVLNLAVREGTYGKNYDIEAQIQGSKAGIAFHVALALVGARGKLDPGYPVWIVNLDYDGFRPYAVTRCKLARGCAVCDESKIAALSVEGFGG